MSWENPPYDNEKEYKDLCSKSVASDFYFSVLANSDFTDGFTMVALTPKVYFDANHCMWDQAMFIDHILPPDFEECLESVWETMHDTDRVKKDLLARGFKESAEFNKLVEEGL